MKDAALTRAPTDANTRRTMHHVFRSRELGSSSPIRRPMIVATIEKFDTINIKMITLAAGASLATISMASAAIQASPQSVQVSTSQAARSEVPLIGQASGLRDHKRYGDFTFEIDSGAGIVVLPRSVAAMRVTTADFLGMNHIV